MTSTTTLARILATDSGVEAGYGHGPKQVTPGEPIEAHGAMLKWYGLHRASDPIPELVTQLARTRLATGPLAASGLGFVILHRCGDSFYFLIVCTWRNSNEMWQTVLYKDAGMAGFEMFPRDGEHKATLCVWELVPVWHEQQAWEKFLLSARDDAAAQAWFADRYRGPA